jgi:hypothetical protein
MDMKGVGVMALNGSGTRSSNRLSVARYVNESAERERSREFKDPVSAFTKFSTQADAMLQRLEPKTQSARAVISKATERKSEGELDDSTYHAETVAARMLLSLQTALKAVYLYAQGTRDIFAVRRVGVVADKLAAVSDELLKESYYPRDESLRQTLVEQTVKMARDAYADAIQSLQGVHETLGVKIADFPEPPCSR